MHGPEGLGSGGGGTPVLRFFDGSEMIQAPPVLSSGDGVSVVVTTGHLSRTATFSADSSVARRSVAQTFTGNQTILGNLILGENGSSGGGISANGGLAVSNNYNGVIIQGTCINIGICMDLNQSGQIHTTGGFYTGGADFAESVAVNRSVKYDPGDVIVIDTTKGRQFTISTSPYSKLVAGVYSTRPGVVASNHPMNGAAFKGEIPLAVVGIVPCKVTSENGPIYPGDLLVSSSIPGYAMKGTNTDKMENAVLGKALGTLSSNVGVIEILVTVR